MALDRLNRHVAPAEPTSSAPGCAEDGGTTSGPSANLTFAFCIGLYWLGLFPYRQRELSTTLSVRCPSAMARVPQWTKLRPSAAGLIGLALAVFLWGLGYKLSLYHQHKSPASQTSVAKLWTGPRSLPLRAVSAFRTRSHLIHDLNALPAQQHGTPWLSQAVLAPLGHGFAVESPAFLIPARSPPPQRLRLT